MTTRLQQLPVVLHDENGRIIRRLDSGGLCRALNGRTRLGADGREHACSCTLPAEHAGEHRFWGLTPLSIEERAATAANEDRPARLYVVHGGAR